MAFQFQPPPPEQPRTDSDTNYAGYLDWKAQGSGKHGIPPASWMFRGGELIRAYPEMANGLVWDIEAIETGWQIWPDGGEKSQTPNPAVHQPLPHPGAGYSEYVKIPMAQDPDTVVLWNQASSGSWKGFCQISAVIHMQGAQNPSLLPVIKFTGATMTITGKNSTQVPNFEIVQWVQRPPCLMQMQAPMPQQAPQVQQAPVPPAAPMPQQPPAAPVPQPQPAPAWGVAPQPQQPAPMAPAAPTGAWNT